MIPVILCGGTGTKMWPASRENLPKHFLPLFNGRSLFQMNWELLRKKYKPSQIYIQTNAHQAKLVLRQVKEVVKKNIFIEPETRNQGPASGFAAAKLFKNFPDEPFMLIQADVLRTPANKVIDMMTECEKVFRRTKKYITGGLKADFTAMGVDYLIPGKLVSKSKNVKIFEVKKFLWRGSKKQVKNYINKQHALIHANHSCTSPRLLLEMFKKYKTDWYLPLANIANGADIKKEYKKMPPGPLENVTQLAHKNKESLVVELPFQWTDLGTWESLVSISGKYASLSSGDYINLDSHNNYVNSAHKKQIALVGVDDLIIVETKDALLVCKQSESAKVGRVVEILKDKGLNHLI